MIICITGAPRSGKTTLANRLGELLALPVIHTDGFLHLHRERQPYEIARKVAQTGSCILEGVSAARLLRPQKIYYLAPQVVFICRNDYAEIKIPGMDWAVEYAEQYGINNEGTTETLYLLGGGPDEASDQGTIF